jgi:proteasome beta subunit
MSMAGTASDAIRNIAIITAELRLKELRTKTSVSVAEAAHLTSNMLFNNIRTPSMIPSIAHFLLAGYDEQGNHLFDLSPDGYLKEVLTYVSSGSGMVQADPILDTEYKKGLSLEEGIKLAIKCIKASTGRDPAVGEGIDVYTITKEEIKQVVSEEIVPLYK